MIDAVRLVVSGGNRNIAFVFAGEGLRTARCRARVLDRARSHGVDAHCRIVDMPGHAGRARRRRRGGAGVETVDIRTRRRRSASDRPAGCCHRGRRLAGKRSVSPRIKDELRTGWLVRPGDAATRTCGQCPRARARRHGLRGTGRRCRRVRGFISAKRGRSRSRRLFRRATPDDVPPKHGPAHGEAAGLEAPAATQARLRAAGHTKLERFEQFGRGMGSNYRQEARNRVDLLTIFYQSFIIQLRSITGDLLQQHGGNGRHSSSDEDPPQPAERTARASTRRSRSPKKCS